MPKNSRLIFHIGEVDIQMSVSQMYVSTGKMAAKTCFPCCVFHFALRFVMDGRCRVRRKENVRNIKWLMAYGSNAVSRLEKWCEPSVYYKKNAKNFTRNDNSTRAKVKGHLVIYVNVIVKCLSRFLKPS